MHYIDIQRPTVLKNTPSDAELTKWALLALSDQPEPLELTLRIVDRAEMTTLNETYRGKKGATNVLSFPFEAPESIESNLLGDIIICAEVVAEEALQQDKPLTAHWAHMVIHGVLHLLGYDHIDPTEAEV